jgi:hypothetical protein
MCLIEFAERASYYGSIGPFNNFINRPLPPGGNGAGAVAPGATGLNQSAGALGMGSVAATGIVQMFTFLVSHHLSVFYHVLTSRHTLSHSGEPSVPTPKSVDSRPSLSVPLSVL